MNIKNHKLHITIRALTFLYFMVWCAQIAAGQNMPVIKIAGEAQGTTYHITYYADINRNYAREVDSLLKEIDSSLSSYLPVSIISRMNTNDTGVVADRFFTDVFKKSQEVSDRTRGAFDITIAPVVNAWGFAVERNIIPDRYKIDSLRNLIGYRMVQLASNKLIKAKRDIMLDVNAIAQGYSVDIVSDFLESKGITSYLVEIGGEVRAKGEKENGELWKVGIEQPLDNLPVKKRIEKIISLKNVAIATSGNYRKYFEENGQKYSHIIDPATCYPARNNLLSATVIATDCISADAYATAFMVMGLEKSRQFLSKNKDLNLEVFFIYDDNGKWKTYASEKIEKWMNEPK